MKLKQLGIVVVWAVNCGIASQAANAAIIGFDAQASTTVQELLDGQAASVSSDLKEWNGVADVLPLQAFASVITSELVGPGGARGQAVSDFDDPQRLDQPNPEEFGLEVAGFANVASVGYTVLSEGVERRIVLFTSPGANPDVPAEIEFDADGTRRVSSRVYVSGAVLIWALDENADLTGISAELGVAVTQDADTTPVFSNGLELLGGADGTLTSEVDFPLVYEMGGLELLTAESGEEAVEQVAAGLENVGTVVVVLIPPQEHTYNYTVTADRQTLLTAEFALRVRNAPGGTGVAAVLGRPFDTLADFIENALPEVDGTALQAALNKSVEDRAVGVDPSDGQGEAAGRSRLCGAFGGEALLLLLLVGLGVVRRLVR